MSRPQSNSKRHPILGRISTREYVLISIFSAFWIASQMTLGPIIGKIAIGSFSLHGVVNRVVGWFLMLILAELSGRFGRVSIMALIVAIITRIIRRTASLYVFAVGLGYALGGLIFDVLFVLPITNNLEGMKRKTYLLLISTISGVMASAPYLFYKLFTLGLYGFMALSPVYALSTTKGIIFSTLGVFIGLPFSSQIKLLLPKSMVE